MNDEKKAWLVPLSGPPLPPLEITPRQGGAVMGRGDGCQLLLPADAQKISRQHASFAYGSARWRVADLGSKWGTFVNGSKLTPKSEVPLAEGDLIRVDPWTFHFSTRHTPRQGIQPDDKFDPQTTSIRMIPMPAHQSREKAADGLLALLLESAAAVNAVGSETELAKVLVELAVRGTGLANAAFVRPVDAAGRVEIVFSNMQDAGSDSSPRFSRSLLNAAGQGTVAELSTLGQTDTSMSIVQMKIVSAICVPLMLGGSVAGFLYLDSRTGDRSRTGVARHAVEGSASAFCAALGRLGGLALASLKRVEMQRRQANIEFDLKAASVAQRWIMPSRLTRNDPLSCLGESRPGSYVGGDFFDVIPLDPHRTAIAIGDVSGHGVAASVLMTAAQGFLHASLRHNPVVSDVVARLNRFVCPRSDGGTFLTLWVGIFDTARLELSYVNAGHGYAILGQSDGSTIMLDAGDNSPVGVDDPAEFAAIDVPLPPAGKALIFSDGIVEQFSPGTDQPGKQFGVHRVKEIFAGISMAGEHDLIATLFDAVMNHGQTKNLQDDTTAVLVQW